MDPHRQRILEEELKRQQNIRNEETSTAQRVEADRKEAENFDRTNRAFIHFATNYMLNKGVELNSYYRRHPNPNDRDIDPQEEDQNFGMESGGGMVKGALKSGIYHSTGKSPFDIVYDKESGRAYAVFGPKNESDGSFKRETDLNKRELRQAKIRALIEFQIKQCVATTVTLDWKSPSNFNEEIMKDFIAIAKEYPVKIGFGPNASTILNHQNPREYLPYGTPGTLGVDLQARVGDWHREFYDAKRDSEIRFNNLFLPKIYKGKKGLEYNQAAIELNRQDNKLGSVEAGNKIVNDFAQATNDNFKDQFDAVEKRVADIDKRIKFVGEVKEKLDSDITNIQAEMSTANTPEALAAAKQKFDDLTTRRQELVSAMDKEMVDLASQKELCGRLLAKFPNDVGTDAQRKRLEELKGKHTALEIPDRQTLLTPLATDKLRERINPVFEQRQKLIADARPGSGPAPAA